MDELSQLPLVPQATKMRPLLGLTILVVEDSRYACEALRLLCLRSGARIRRADSLKSARRHLNVYRPSAIIVDVGLPDGDGIELINTLARETPRIGVILGISGETMFERPVLNAGANGFLAKPITSLGEFQHAIMQHLPDERKLPGPWAISDEEIEPDPLALQDDLMHAADILDAGLDQPTLDYVARFTAGIALTAKDDLLYRAATELTRKDGTAMPPAVKAETLSRLVQKRLAQKQAI